MIFSATRTTRATFMSRICKRRQCGASVAAEWFVDDGAAHQVRLGDMPGTPRFKVGPALRTRDGDRIGLGPASAGREGLLGAIRERQLLTAYRRVLLNTAPHLLSASILNVETAEQ